MESPAPSPGRLNLHLRSPRIPLWVKLLYTAFLCVLVPYYWSAYGPTNFLYYCDVALFMTLAALWTESALLASMRRRVRFSVPAPLLGPHCIR